MDEEKKIKEALSQIGLHIDSIYDLVNTSKSYPQAINVLINLLKEGINDDNTKEGLIRALAVKEAKGKAGTVLIEEFYKTPSEKQILRWTIGNSMAVVITPENVPDVIKIVTDPNNGMARQTFVLALGKVPASESEDVLIKLLDDMEVAGHALDALGRLKSQKAANKISELISHKNTFIRNEAQKALKKIRSANNPD